MPIMIGFLVLLSVILIIDLITVKANHKIELNHQLETLTFVKDKYMDETHIPYNQKVMKYYGVYTMYLELFSSPIRKHRMNKWQMADYGRLAAYYTIRLNLPRFYLICVPIMESDLDPNKKGGCRELGICHQHPAVMGTVYLALHQMRGIDPELAKELNPMIHSHSDLQGNPIASLKCQALIAWFCKRKFHDNAIWWVSAAHWGYHRMERYYVKDTLPPMRFVFRSIKEGKLKIDSRNPLKYYAHWQGIHNKLSLGRIDIYPETKRLIKKYKKYLATCRKNERDYILAIKYKNKLLVSTAKMEVKIERQQKEINILAGRFREYKNIILDMDKAYRKIYKECIVKEKNFEKAYSLYDKLFRKVVNYVRKKYKEKK